MFRRHAVLVSLGLPLFACHPRTGEAGSDWKFLSEKGCQSASEILGRPVAVSPESFARDGCTVKDRNALRALIDCREVPDYKAIFVLTKEACP